MIKTKLDIKSQTKKKEKKRVKAVSYKAESKRDVEEEAIDELRAKPKIVL